VSEGQIIAKGNAAAILSNEKVREVYLGDQFQI
jgi:ABC-type lipopolysaccharide export system ATPase subunit